MLNKLGYGNIPEEYKLGKEDMIMNINSMSAQISRAFGEGIISTPMNILGGAAGAVKGAGQGIGMAGRAVKGTVGAVGTAAAVGKNAVQVGIFAMKKLIELIKKIIVGFVDMVKKFILELGNQKARMAKASKMLKEMEQKMLKIKDVIFDDIDNDKLSLTFVTTVNMNAAGWNLKLPEGARSGGIKNKDRLTIAWFCTLIAESYNGDTYTKLAQAKDFPEMLDILEQMFVDAGNIIRQDKMYYLQQEFQQINKTVSIQKNERRWLSLRVFRPSFHKYTYKNVDPVLYGKYVASAFSPAGAYVNVDKKDFNKITEKRQLFTKNITPQKTSGIPLDAAYDGNGNGEIMNTMKYLFILLNYFSELDPNAYFQNKMTKIANLKRQVDNMVKLSQKQIKDMNKDMKNSAKYNPTQQQYDSSGNTIQYNSPEYKKQTVEPTGMGASFNFTHQAMLDELAKGYGEEDTKWTDISQHNTTYDSVEGLDGTTIDKNIYSNKGKEDPGTLTTDMKVNAGDLTSAYSYYVLQYLQQFLLQSGNIVFQEGRFYNHITKTLCDITEEFVKYIEANYIKLANEKSANELDQDQQNREQEKQKRAGNNPNPTP